MSLKSAPVVHAEAYTPDMKDDGFWLEEKPFKITVIREIIHIANFNGARLYEAKIGKEDIEKKNMPHDIDLAAKLMTDILLNHVKNSRFNLTYGECGVKIEFELLMEYSKFDFEFYLQEKGGEMDRMGRQIELLKDQSLKLHKEVQGLEGEKLLDIADNMSHWLTLQFIRHTIPDKFGDIMKTMNEIIEEIILGLQKNNIVKIHNFGTFKIKSKKSRIGRNPKTKEEVMISARNVVSFIPSKYILKKLNLNFDE